MKLFINYNHHKTTIIFIHGFRKNHDDFNITDKGKNILIETTMAKICNTILVQIEESDYKKPVADVAEDIYKNIVDIDKTKITIVAHSHGSFYALSLCETYPDLFCKLLLIDPTTKSEHYLTKLKMDTEGFNEESVESYKVKYFDMLPTGFNLKNKIIVRIHLNLQTTQLIDDLNSFLAKINHLNKLVNKNVKSRLVLHADVSHMIHYQIPDVIIDSIKELHKLL